MRTVPNAFHVFNVRENMGVWNGDNVFFNLNFRERLNVRDLNNNNNPEVISEKSGNDL
jgi:hypothetical protein